MLKKYFVQNTLTGGVCFNGKRFWTARGAIWKIRRVPPVFRPFMELRKVVS